MRLKKLPTGTLILAGLAAFAYYKYSRMSEEQKNNLIERVKKSGKNFYDSCIPGSLKNLFIKNEKMFYDDGFGEHSDYSF